VKTLLLTLVGTAFVLGVVGCSAGEVTQDDIKRNTKAQADFIKSHPGKPGTEVGN
jgi:hypothetical protein